MRIALNAGHGGTTLKNGYLTPGKRGPLGKWGQIFEGVSNRAFVNDLAFQLTLLGHQVEIISHSNLDNSLGSRGRRAAEIKPDLLLDIHSNAMSEKEFGNYTGFEIFTTEGETSSDRFAKHIAKGLKTEYPHVRWRMGPGGEHDKEKNYTVIYMAEQAGVQAVLLEILFMDGIQDYEMLTDPVWRTNLMSHLAKLINNYSL